MQKLIEENKKTFKKATESLRIMRQLMGLAISRLEVWGWESKKEYSKID